jgi:hypothetical protein
MINKDLRCKYPCTDVNKGMIYPKLNIDPNALKLIMISEAPPIDHLNYFYKGSNSE